MIQWFARSVLALVAFGFGGQFLSAKALMVRQLSTPERVVVSDAIVVGKVVAIEDKEVEATMTPGAPMKVAYKIASIKVDATLSGLKGVTQVRVGFIALPSAGEGAPGRLGRIRPGMNPQLNVGQEGVFFLARHHEADFMVVPPAVTHLDKKAEGYDKQVEFVRKAIRLLAEPVKSLKAEDASDRFLAATLLVQKYNSPRSWTGGAMRPEPIAAEESRLILKAIYEADWTRQDQDVALAPLAVFQRLGVQPMDGFKYPVAVPGQDFNVIMQQTARNWLKEHQNTFRVKRYVEEVPK